MSGNQENYDSARIVDALLAPFTHEGIRLSREEAIRVFPRKDYQLMRVEPASKTMYTLKSLLEQRC